MMLLLGTATQMTSARAPSPLFPSTIILGSGPSDDLQQPAPEEARMCALRACRVLGSPPAVGAVKEQQQGAELASQVQAAR
jgi:hypothetical protein